MDEVDLHVVTESDLQEAEKTIQFLADSTLAAVPIILTSAVKGTGIQKLHAFLRKLPVPDQQIAQNSESTSPLFYIEDVYSLRTDTSNDRSAIIGGYLRHGSMTVGDELLLGPYPIDITSDDSDSGSSSHRPVTGKSAIQTSRSFPGALHTKHAGSQSLRDRHNEWRRVRITSLRNLRLPVRTLRPGQVGTMCITPVSSNSTSPITSPAINRIRKGMVLSAQEARAHKLFTVRFEGAQADAVKHLSIGSAVVVYVASVRASSKVLSIMPEQLPTGSGQNQGCRPERQEEDGFGFGFDDEPEEQRQVQQEWAASEDQATLVTFQFIASREFVEMGAKVLVMPGGGPGLSSGNERGAKGFAGLEGFVGSVVEQG